MPTILIVDGFRFFFYASDQNEPCHIHVNKGDGIGKIWLSPQISIQYLNYFTKTEERKILDIVHVYQPYLIKQWYEFFQ